MENNNAKLPKLTVDVFDRPDCPEWAKWAAVDGDGVGHVFDGKPDKGVLSWKCCYVNGSYIGKYDPSDWENSLIERPAAESETAPADKSTPEHDDVKAPAYYVNTPFGLELKKITCHYDFNCGSALKYIIRHGKKIYGGMTAKESAIKDLRKAIECLQNEIEYIREQLEE